MPTYRTTFERANWDFDPVLTQSADVVFVCDCKNDSDDNYNAIRNAAWDAMWKQNPHWKDPSSPLKGYSGWSSVSGGIKFIEVIDKDLDFDLGEPGIGLPRIAETFKRRGEDDHGGLYDRSYRVTGFYKTWTPPQFNEDPILDELIAEIKEKERDEMTAEQRSRKEQMIKIVHCERDEAEFISGAGVGGCIIRIEDAIITGRVNWEDRTIARARKNYKVHSNDFPIEIWKYWEN